MLISKTWSILDWFLIMLVNLIGVITSYVIYPLVYLFRNQIRKHKQNPIIKLFWYYLDDTDGDYGAPYWLRDKPKNFFTAYRWSVLRNPAWNLQESLKRKGKIFEILSVKGNVFRNFERVGALQNAQLKYVDPEGNYSDNKGEYLSLEYSSLGSKFVWYTSTDKNEKKRLYWNYTLAKKLNKIGLWIELHLGITYRYTFRFKLKRVNVYPGDL